MQHFVITEHLLSFTNILLQMAEVIFESSRKKRELYIVGKYYSI